MHKTLLTFVDEIYEDLELWYPKLRLEEAGFAMRVAGPELKTYTGKHGYPAKADPDQIDKPMTVVLLTILVIYVTLVYGPIAAWLVEMFPTRIRYTSMSLPYHIGNGWFGGFLPAISFSIVAAQGNIYSGLWYPIIIASITFVIGMLFIKETKDVDIYADD